MTKDPNELYHLRLSKLIREYEEEQRRLNANTVTLVGSLFGLLAVVVFFLIWS